MSEVLILVLSFVILLAIGVPVAWSIGISCILTILVSIDSLAAFTTVAQRMATGLDSFSLLAIPLFILVGQIMNQGGIANRLIAFAKALMGALPGVSSMSTSLLQCSSVQYRVQPWQPLRLWEVS